METEPQLTRESDRLLVLVHRSCRGVMAELCRLIWPNPARQRKRALRKRFTCKGKYQDKGRAFCASAHTPAFRATPEEKRYRARDHWAGSASAFDRHVDDAILTQDVISNFLADTRMMMTIA